MAIKNVLLIGGGGNLGGEVVKAITAEPSLTLTVLSREGSTSTFPDGVRVIQVDYNSHDSLVTAFKGQDVVISNVATFATLDQLKFIDAAVEAGVARFIPSEFGSVASSEGAVAEEFWGKVGFKGKGETYARLQELADAQKLEYTLFANGPFFDWGLDQGFIGFNFKEKKATIFGSGNQTIAVSNIPFIAKAVVWSLLNPDTTKNQTLKIYSHKITQNGILAELEKIDGATWAVQNVDVEGHVRGGQEAYQAGNPYAGYQVLQGLIFDEADKYGSNFSRLDVPVRDEKTVEQVLKEALVRNSQA